MDTMSAFVMGEANRGKPLRVFDWDEAARRIVASGATYAAAGLSEDWDWTEGVILRDGKPTTKAKSGAYLASTWATPVLALDRDTGDCFRLQKDTPGWDADTHWPDSALAILNGVGK